VIIDEAQAIPVRTLRQLQQLLNLDTAGSKLLQIVLAGQPELKEKLRLPELRRLHRRVIFRCSLLPLWREETAQYVKSRLVCAGATNVDVFAQESLDATYMYSQGIPRVVNLLCEHALGSLWCFEWPQLYSAGFRLGA
jgi:general secretion pathway protein A